MTEAFKHHCMLKYSLNSELKSFSWILCKVTLKKRIKGVRTSQEVLPEKGRVKAKMHSGGCLGSFASLRHACYFQSMWIKSVL